MGIITDRASIQFRMLNRSKGPAMWSPRAQCDRMKFSQYWRETLENIPNLHMWQDCANELIVEDGKAVGVKTQLGAEFRAKCTIITAGTFLNGVMHVGKVQFEGGRIAEPAAKGLTESIKKHGVTVGRMKTGTPVRLDKRSINMQLVDIQQGDNDFHSFSYLSNERKLTQLPCWACYTNPEVHQTLRDGLEFSPLYNGQIQSLLTHPGLEHLETTDFGDILNDPEIDTVIELIGGMEPAHTFTVQALKAGKNVVSANKLMISHHMEELLTLAREHGVQYRILSKSLVLPWST